MSTPNAIRIMIVDDHPVVREGLVAMISRYPDMSVVAEAETGLEAIELFQQHNPDITLIDLRLQPGIGGVEVIEKIRKETPTARFIVITTFDGDRDIYRALQAGAQAYLLKDMSRDEFINAIRIVHSGQKFIPQKVAHRLADHVASSDLSLREIEILEQMVRGNSNKQIGMILSISEATVKWHVTNIFNKLGVTDRSQAIVTAIQRGICHL
jgi:DNA-binding NarL/FixJ family response regulator